MTRADEFRQRLLLAVVTRCWLNPLGIPGNLDLEIRTLRLAEGRGYATLLKYDAVVDAILIERLSDQLAEAPMSVDEKIEFLSSMATHTYGTRFMPKAPLPSTGRAIDRLLLAVPCLVV